MSSTQWTGGTIRDLFDDITGDENAASDVEYRCIFIHNSHGTLALTNAKVWLSAEVAGGASVALALDGTGVVSATSASAQAERIANENTAPTGETFTSPTTKAGSTISIASLGAGQCVGLWIRRTAANTAALAADGFTLQVQGDSAA